MPVIEESTHLPTEIWDMILQHVSKATTENDRAPRRQAPTLNLPASLTPCGRKSLLAFRLTAKMFVDSASKLLFQHIDATIMYPCSTISNSLGLLMGLSGSPYSRLVRHVEFGFHNLENTTPYEANENYIEAFRKLAIHCLQGYPNLEILQFHGTRFAGETSRRTYIKSIKEVLCRKSVPLKHLTSLQISTTWEYLDSLFLSAESTETHRSMEEVIGRLHHLGLLGLHTVPGEVEIFRREPPIRIFDTYAENLKSLTLWSYSTSMFSMRLTSTLHLRNLDLRDMKLVWWHASRIMTDFKESLISVCLVRVLFACGPGYDRPQVLKAVAEMDQLAFFHMQDCSCLADEKAYMDGNLAPEQRPFWTEYGLVNNDDLRLLGEIWGHISENRVRMGLSELDTPPTWPEPAANQRLAQ